MNRNNNHDEKPHTYDFGWNSSQYWNNIETFIRGHMVQLENFHSRDSGYYLPLPEHNDFYTKSLY